MNTISVIATRYKRVIQPLLCFSIDFYVRIFVRIKDSGEDCRDAGLTSGYLLQCPRCPTYYIQPVATRKENKCVASHVTGAVCVGCSHPEPIIAGPLYIGRLHDIDFVSKLLHRVSMEPSGSSITTTKRMRGMLTLAMEEVDIPLYFTRELLGHVFHVQPPTSSELTSALITLGYSVSGTHASSLGVKTSAPWSIIWDIMRCWVSAYPPHEKWHRELYPDRKLEQEPAAQPNEPTTGEQEQTEEPKHDSVRSAGAEILSKTSPVTLDISIFSEVRVPKRPYRQQGIVRFQHNPTKNWGPKKRAKGK